MYSELIARFVENLHDNGNFKLLVLDDVVLTVIVHFCLMVDELIGKQEVVIKSLGETFKNVTGVAGGSILGDGRVGLILDVEALFGNPSRE